MKLVAVSLSLIALGPTRADLHFAPVKGLELHKVFEEKTEWSVKTAEQIVGGTPHAEQVPEMNCRQSRRLVVNDRYGAIEDGVPLQLSRDLESIEGACSLEFKIPQASDQVDLTLQSALAGAKLIFERKDAKAEPRIKFADDAGASSVSLEGLREDLDLRAFLTETGLEVGDHWTVDAAVLGDVLAPGGDVGRVPQRGSIDPGDLHVLTPSQVVAATLCSLADGAGTLEGEVLCTWKETKKDGDSELALIELEWDARSRSSLDERLKRASEAAGVRDETDFSFALAWRSEGKGQLVWDLTAKHAHSLELELDSKVDVQIDAGNGSWRYGLEARSELSAKFEAK